MTAPLVPGTWVTFTTPEGVALAGEIVVVGDDGSTVHIRTDARTYTIDTAAITAVVRSPTDPPWFAE